ncbi:hypothetical protein GCM10028864_57560 [Microlunatus parietis]
MGWPARAGRKVARNAEMTPPPDRRHLEGLGTEAYDRRFGRLIRSRARACVTDLQGNGFRNRFLASRGRCIADL